MSKDTHMVKVYEEDWKALNTFLSMLQIERGGRLSFADAVHHVVKICVIPYMDNFMKASMRSET